MWQWQSPKELPFPYPRWLWSRLFLPSAMMAIITFSWLPAQKKEGQSWLLLPLPNMAARCSACFNCVTAFAETKQEQELTLPPSSSPFSSSEQSTAAKRFTHNSSPTCCFPQFWDGHFLVSSRHLIKYPYNNCILISECNCFLYFHLSLWLCPW